MTGPGPKLLRGLLEVFILESLEQAPKHGYALLKEMTESFGAEPNRNRLYPLLARMVRDGHIREVSESGGNRTLYALTDAGRDALHAYRRLPGAFRHALRRIWAVEVAHAAGAETTPPGEAATTEVPPAVRAVPVLLGEAEDEADEAPDGDPPYPCPDARVAMEKDPRRGDLALRLTGCPMGAYEYCPSCPVYKAVEGLRFLTFG